MEKKWVIGILIIAVVLVLAFLLYPKIFPNNANLDESSFKIDPVLLKFTLKQGESISTTFNINNLDLKQNFNLEVVNLGGFVSLEEKSFELGEGESKKINVQISGADKLPGVYVGHIIVKNALGERKIPVILGIHTAEQLFAINLDVGSGHKQLEPNEETVTEVKFFNLRDTYQHTINTTYKIFDIEGKEIAFEEETIDVGSQSSLTKTIPLPGNVFLGDYFFVVTLDYENTKTTSSYLFSVVDKKNPFSLLDVNFLAFVVVIFIIVVFIFILYMLYERNRLFSSLGSQQKSQVKYYSKGISKQEKKYLAKAKTDSEKKKIVSEFRDAKTKILQEMKKQHGEQAKEFKDLKKKKKKEVAEKKLHEWKHKDYNRALRSAQISHDLKNKLATLTTAYSEGYIKRKSYKKGVKKIKSAHKKLKRNVYK